MTTYVYNEHDENQVLTMRNKLKKKSGGFLWQAQLQ